MFVYDNLQFDSKESIMIYNILKQQPNLNKVTLSNFLKHNNVITLTKIKEFYTKQNSNMILLPIYTFPKWLKEQKKGEL